jgi:hypothetical protein
MQRVGYRCICLLEQYINMAHVRNENANYQTLRKREEIQSDFNKGAIK